MSKITPKIAERILEADAANALDKIKSGKSITSSQRAYLLSIAGKQNVVPVDGKARNYVELANILEVSRSCVNKWAKDPDSPTPDSNGKHDVSKWLSYIQAKGLKGAEGEDEGDLKRRRLLAQCLKIEAELDIIRGNWLPKDLVEQYMQDVFTACRSKILQSPLDEQATDELLHELSRLQKTTFAIRPNRDESKQQLQSVGTPSEVVG